MDSDQIGKILLSTQGLGKVYPPATVALDGCDFSIIEGQIHGVVGVNGAGKSTLIKLLSGVERPSAGHILIADKPVELGSPADAHRHGIGVVHQELPLFDNLSVAENLFMGVEERGLLAPLVRRRASRAYQAIAERFPGAPRSDEMVGDLSIGKRQVASIIRALACGARVLILDEATSSLPTAERVALHANLRRVADEGIGILYVSHFIDDVLDVCDQVTVIRDGCIVSSQHRSSIASSSDVIRSMTGQAVTEHLPRGATLRTGQSTALALSEFQTGDVQSLDLTVASGECVALYGLEGCGAREILLGVFGLAPHSGQVIATGEPVDGSPVRRMAAGIAMVSGDRRRTLMIHQTVRANFELPHLARQKLVAPARSNAGQITASLQTFGVKGSADQALSTLSGGNQQKVALGRWLEPLPTCLLADEPTRGIDVGGRAALHRQLGKLLDQGMGMLLFSSDPEEVVTLADRVVVIENGQVVGELTGAAISVRAIEEATRSQHATERIGAD